MSDSESSYCIVWKDHTISDPVNSYQEAIRLLESRPVMMWALYFKINKESKWDFAGGNKQVHQMNLLG